MSQVVVGKIEAVAEMEVGEAALYGAVGGPSAAKMRRPQDDTFLEMDAMTEIAERDG